MTTMASPQRIGSGDNLASLKDSRYSLHDDADHYQSYGFTQDSCSADPKSLPMQKRQRLGKACEECRRNKTKCDRKQPCTHCTAYSYKCSYDRRSDRRRNPAWQYVEVLENRLKGTEDLLRTVLPNINLDSPQFEVHATEKGYNAPHKTKDATYTAKASTEEAEIAAENGDADLLETIVDISGCLDRDEQGDWQYYGHTSEITMVRQLRKQMSVTDIIGPMLCSCPSTTAHMLSPKYVSESPQNTTFPPTLELPPRIVALRLCHNAIDHACFLMKFVHEPSFFASLERIYDIPSEQLSNEDHMFLPLLYIAIAVGCLFPDDGPGMSVTAGYEGSIGQGLQFFKISRQLLDVTDCRDLPSLQAICFMVLFLQSSAKFSACYTYVGIALHSALRLGLHRTVATDFNPIEREVRKRIFWVVRKMDIYVSTLLGLPQMLSDADIDQEYPMEVDGDFTTSERVTQPPSDLGCGTIQIIGR